MKKRVINFITVCLLVLTMFGGNSLYALQRGPSTPEERKKMVELITFLENEPLAKESKERRKEVLFWLTQVPDITVSVCADVLGGLKKIKGDYSSELLAQQAFSEAKFVIENPDKAKDDYSVYLAGVEGILRAYKSIKKEKPKVKIEAFEELEQKQEKGTLGEYVRVSMASCK
jgi:hypothetical protein